jgi:hypothetical protein
LFFQDAVTLLTTSVVSNVVAICFFRMRSRVPAGQAGREQGTKSDPLAVTEIAPEQ